MNVDTIARLRGTAGVVMYLTRDKNNDLYLFDKLPVKGAECWWAEAGVDGTYLRLDKSLYPEITWDSQPVPVELKFSGRE